MTNSQAIAQTYRMNQISGASPLDLLIMAYDVALASAGQGDLDRFTRALTVLREALDYSHDADIAMGFFRLYQYCGDLARKGEFDEAATLIRELRDSWAEVRAQYQMPQAVGATTAPSAYGAPAGQYESAGIAIAG